MAVDARTIVNVQATDADHRTFAQAIHAMLIAAGLVQTADSGQANLATIIRPTVANTASGYEVFRFNDAEQATLPCFLKVEYGSASPTAVPGIRVTAGTATNGAGTLSNTLTLATAASVLGWTNLTDAPGQLRPAFASLAEGQLCIAFGLDAANGRGAFIYLGRPRLYDGTRTTDGLILLYRGNQTGTGVLRAAGGAPPAASGLGEWPVVDTLGGWDDQAGVNVGLYPLSYAINGNLRFASLFSYRAAAIAADAEQTVDLFGAPRNYRTLGGVATVTDASLAVPYF